MGSIGDAVVALASTDPLQLKDILLILEFKVSGASKAAWSATAFDASALVSLHPDEGHQPPP